MDLINSTIEAIVSEATRISTIAGLGLVLCITAFGSIRGIVKTYTLKGFRYELFLAFPIGLLLLASASGYFLQSLGTGFYAESVGRAAEGIIYDLLPAEQSARPDFELAMDECEAKFAAGQATLPGMTPTDVIPICLYELDYHPVLNSIGVVQFGAFILGWAALIGWFLTNLFWPAPAMRRPKAAST